MHCPECGNEVISQAVYCHHCGGRLEIETGSEASGTEQSPSGSGSSDTIDRFRATAARPGNGYTQDRDDDEEQERTLWVGRYSPKAMVGRWILSAAVTVLLPVVGFYFGRPWFWWAILVAIVLLWLYQLGVMLYRQMSVRYQLSTQRFMHEHGILSRTTDRIELIDVDDIAFRQGLIERMVNVGTIEITSSDRSHPQLEMIGIENVRDVAQMLDDARRRERRRRGLHIESI